ncbi:MAG: nucleotidyltransferase domain-containing protein [Elusimicrobiota bacterium]
MDKNIFKKELTKIVEITKEYGAKSVILFGSCVENVETARDIDVAVKGVKPRLFFEMYGKILDVIDSEIDLVPLENARKHFAQNIIGTGQWVYGKK